MLTPTQWSPPCLRRGVLTLAAPKMAIEAPKERTIAIEHEKPAVQAKAEDKATEKAEDKAMES